MCSTQAAVLILFNICNWFSLHLKLYSYAMFNKKKFHLQFKKVRHFDHIDLWLTAADHMVNSLL